LTDPSGLTRTGTSGLESDKALACEKAGWLDSAVTAGWPLFHWGSRGRRFKSGRPDAGQRPLLELQKGPLGLDGSANGSALRDTHLGWMHSFGRASTPAPTSSRGQK